MKAWLTVAEAALLTGKSSRAIYRWIDGGRLTPRTGEHGEILIQSAEVLRVESETRRGRPKILA